MRYLAKYFMKSLAARRDKAYCQKNGLLPGMGIYKFFKFLYKYPNGVRVPVGRIQRVKKTTQTYLNDSLIKGYEAEEELRDYFTTDKKGEVKLKRNFRQIAKEKNDGNFSYAERKQKPKWTIAEIIKMCLRYASSGRVNKSQTWRRCQVEYEQLGCQMVKEHHTEKITQLQFNFNGYEAYWSFKFQIEPLLSQLDLPKFIPFAEFQPTNHDYYQFAEVSSYP
ncbi:33698_t:CDS:1 [Racocetra persica]|uniref:33698_t:CDS:1 n=1 Tax=Racocetra persica TaxID=160502 RepID=A0ACA9RP36_9GLOM|nr:33698_t:CDS:1 [Racocetra persica]